MICLPCLSSSPFICLSVHVSLHRDSNLTIITEKEKSQIKEKCIMKHMAKTCQQSLCNSWTLQKKKKKKYKLDLENIKVLCKEDKLIPHKVQEAIFIKRPAPPSIGTGVWTYKDIWFTSGNTKFKEAAKDEFQKWISQLQFSYHPLRMKKGLGFSKIFGSKTCCWTVFKLSLKNHKNISSNKICLMLNNHIWGLFSLIKSNSKCSSFN